MRWKVPFLVVVAWNCAACSEGATPPPEVICDSSKAAGLSIAAGDVYGVAPYAFGYPPYAIDGCQVLYLARSNTPDGGGELRLRNLATNHDDIIAEASTSPRRPVLAGNSMAWEGDVDGKAWIHLRRGMQSKTEVLNGDFDHATEPRIATNALVFTLWRGPESTADTEIGIYDFETRAVETIVRPGQQRFADISDTHVAWTDFSEDPDGHLDENAMDIADIVVMNRQTGAMATRVRIGKQAFPMLGATGKLAFLDWNLVHPEPKLVAYDLRIADVNDTLNDSVLIDTVKTTAPYIRPSAHGEWIEWIAFEEGLGSGVWRTGTDTTATPEIVLPPSWVNRFAPIATDSVTFIGTQRMDGSVALEAFTR